MRNRRSAREHEELAGNRGLKEAFKETTGEKLSTFFLPLFITAKLEVIATTKPFLGAWSEKKNNIHKTQYVWVWSQSVNVRYLSARTTCFSPQGSKKLGSEITKLLTVLCNLWFAVKSILEEWKVAYEILSFRKDFRENLETTDQSV